MKITATLHQVQPLIYSHPSPELGLPIHVRAGSSIRHWNGYRVVVQDDVNALAIVDEKTGKIFPVALPPGPDGQRVFGDNTGNKKHKLDLEASIVLPDGRLVAFGSGSRPAREVVVVLDVNYTTQVVQAHDFYQQLHDTKEFSGSELNVEGAIVVHDMLRLFQRGNGVAKEGLLPVDATAEFNLEEFVQWLAGGDFPKIQNIRRFNLGHNDGVPYGFTDATALPDGRAACLVCAEDSPDTYQDGEVKGCRVGLMEEARVLWADILNADGSPCKMKFEGIDFVAETADGFEFVVVADMDDPNTPAIMARLEIRQFRITPQA